MSFQGNSVERTDKIADFKFSEIVYTLIQEILTRHPYVEIEHFRTNVSLQVSEMLIEMDKNYSLSEARQTLNKESIAYLESKRSKE